MTKAIFIFFRENFEKKTTQLEDLYEDLRELLRKFVTKDMVESSGFDIWKYHNVERKILTIGSLFPSDEARIKNPNLHLESLLVENAIKKEEPDDFFIMACGKKEIDEEIWKQVSRFPKNATMLYETEKGFVKVTGIRKSYFEGEEVIFPKKEEKINSSEQEKKIKKAKIGFQKICESAPEIIGPPKKFM